MTHLTDEQFEDVVEGRQPQPDHVDECGACRDRLAEHKAVRARLQSAFASVRAGPSLVERVRRAARPSPRLRRAAVASASATSSCGGPPEPSRRRSAKAATQAGTPAANDAHRRPPRIHRLSGATWAAIAAAAAVLVIAIPALIYLTAPESASAAPAELARIHTDNLQAQREFFSDADPARLAEYLKTRVGFQPATPRLGQGMAMRGCCVAHFKGQAVGSYVVDTPRGPFSVIVVPQAPDELGMGRSFLSGGKTFWADTFAANNMVAVRIGGYSYCAVGEVPQELLTQVLLNLGLGE